LTATCTTEFAAMISFKPAKAALGLLAAMSLGVAASAAPVDPEARLADEFVVHGRLPGPAWWKVSRGGSTVFVLGVPGAMPKGMAWDTAVLERRLKGASQVIGPPQVTAGVGDMGAMLKLHSNAPMEQGLSPGLRTRLAATETRMGRDPGRYSHWTPLIAGMRIVGDFREGASIDSREPAKTVSRLAHSAGVGFQPAATYPAGALLKAVTPQLGAVGETCIADALDEVDAGAARLRTAATGWAQGDPKAALSASRGYEKCVNALPAGADLARRAMSDTTGAIERALAKPGHAIAVVNLRTLLASGGVLEQLRARGYAVTTPGEE
jgi:hypothetical protein